MQTPAPPRTAAAAAAGAAATVVPEASEAAAETAAVHGRRTRLARVRYTADIRPPVEIVG